MIVNKQNSIEITTEVGCNEKKISLKAVNIYIKGLNNFISIKKTCSFENCSIYIANSNVRIYIDENNKFTDTYIRCAFGNNQSFIAGKNSRIFGCKFYLDEESSFQMGDDNLLSQEIKIWCCDGHSILDNKTNTLINTSNKTLTIGNHNWIGQCVIFTKNAHIENNTIIGAGSVVTKSFSESNIIIAGNPAKIIKKNVSWIGTNPYYYKIKRLDVIEK